MKKTKFIEDAKLYPSRYYRNPTDVVRDRRLTNADRLEILAAWEREARGLDALVQLRLVREELQRSQEAARGPSEALANDEKC
jgi:hypothetical protein